VPPDDVQALGAQLAAPSREDVARRSAAAARAYDRRLNPAVVLDAYERCYEAALEQAPLHAPHR
jgi:hypothetical protein